MSAECGVPRLPISALASYPSRCQATITTITLSAVTQAHAGEFSLSFIAFNPLAFRRMRAAAVLAVS
jgi:hypothetical protein